MRIAIAQINTTIADFEGNTQKVLAYLKKAESLKSDLVLFPELVVSGYPPKDLLEKFYFVEKGIKCVEDIASKTADTAVVVGFASKNESGSGRALYNSAALCHKGRTKFIQHKSLLPTYDVFDEARYFEEASERNVFTLSGVEIGITICEDVWSGYEIGGRRIYNLNPVEELVRKGARIILNISASPFHAGKIETRIGLFSNQAKRFNVPIVVCNSVGGNDELIFDGRSLIFDASGQLVSCGKAFQEDMVIVDIDCLVATESPTFAPEIEDIYDALVLGIRDYVRKCSFANAVVGLSGGIDSAVTTVLAKEALGTKHVTVIGMPSMYSSKSSIEDARKLASNLGLRFIEVPITDIYFSYLDSLGIARDKITLAEENLQARIRGNILMAFSNRTGSIVLSTGNKSELAVGYCTLYGDMAGGLAVLSDVPKTMVYKLAEFINRDGEIIPASIIEKAPSAELKPNQRDEDSLPPYDILDRILRSYIEEHKSPEFIKSMGFDASVVDEVIRRVDRNEYKRRQAPLGLKVTSKAFGSGRRFPVAWRYF